MIANVFRAAIFSKSRLADLLLGTAAILSAFAISALGHEAVSEKATENQCLTHLRQIGSGVTAYRKGRGNLPEKLSELYPKYVNDRKVFHCPMAPYLVRTADSRARLAKRFTTYSYMYASTKRALQLARKNPHPDDSLADSYTWDELLRMRGDQLPLVMCSLHDPFLRRGQGGDLVIMLLLRTTGTAEKRTLRVSDQPRRRLMWYQF